VANNHVELFDIPDAFFNVLYERHYWPLSVASQSSRTLTISDISQGLRVTFAARFGIASRGCESIPVLMDFVAPAQFRKPGHQAIGPG
jgi:hypothetical protein